MKKLFYVVVAAIVLTISGCKCHCVCCADTEQINSSDIYGVNATNAQTFAIDTLDNAKIDSLVRVDRLPKISKWAVSQFKDEETGQMNEYRTLYDKETKTVYTLKKIGNGLYVLQKRTLNVR